jgi:hypothetical protein
MTSLLCKCGCGQPRHPKKDYATTNCGRKTTRGNPAWQMTLPPKKAKKPAEQTVDSWWLRPGMEDRAVFQQHCESLIAKPVYETRR